MNINSIKRICKDSMQIIVRNNGFDQWLGSESAMYLLPRISTQYKAEDIFSMWDLPGKDRDDYLINDGAFPDGTYLYPVSNRDSSAELITRAGLCLGGAVYFPVKTSRGVCGIAEKWLKPIGKLECEWYERSSQNMGLYLVAAQGFMIQAIIRPIDFGTGVKGILEDLARGVGSFSAGFIQSPDNNPQISIEGVEGEEVNK